LSFTLMIAMLISKLMVQADIRPYALPLFNKNPQHNLF
jgi:hypothetical protein